MEPYDGRSANQILNKHSFLDLTSNKSSAHGVCLVQTLPYVPIIVRNPESYVDNLLEWSIQGPSSLMLQNPQAVIDIFKILNQWAVTMVILKTLCASTDLESFNCISTFTAYISIGK
ncbi:hypothetical protein KY285_033792 [Solanum tuberosum]|nr:hypothetical protein KY285_033792 [Solanum tuberosum]